MTFRICLLILISLLLTGNILAQTETQNFENEIKQLEDFINTGLITDRIPGMSVAFFKDDFIYTNGFGLADLEQEVSANDKTSYRLGSLTKTMTALAVMKLYQENKLDLDDPVEKYVTELKGLNPALTIRHLLHEFSYFPPMDASALKDGTTEEINHLILDHVKKNIPECEAGQQYYSGNTDYELLGLVIEKISGKFITQFTHENIWNFLYMVDTGFYSTTNIIPNRSGSYEKLSHAIQKHIREKIPYRYSSADSRSNVIDLIKYLNGLRFNRIISEQTTRIYLSGYECDNESRKIRGMGWEISPLNGYYRVIQTTSPEEDAAAIAYYPESDFGIVILTNLKNANLSHYLSGIHSIVLKETDAKLPYSNKRQEKLILNAIKNAFNYGIAFNSLGIDNTALSDEQVKNAFRFFENYTNSDQNSKNIQFDDFFENTKNLGMYIARRLAGNGINYHQSGAVSFFTEYIALYSNQPKWPDQLKFNSTVEKLVKEWNSKFTRVLTNPYFNSLHITTATDLNQLQNQIKKIKNEFKIIPDLTDELIDLTSQYAATFSEEKTLNTLTIADQIYTEDAKILMEMGLAFAWFADAVIIRETYERASKIDFLNYISPEIFTERAELINSFHRFNNALNLVEESLRIFPGNAELLYEKAKILHLLNHNKQARTTLKKAIKAGPSLKKARELAVKLNLEYE